MDLTYHTQESIYAHKNSFVLAHQNIRGITSKIEESQKFFSKDKIYPHMQYFSDHHMSRDDVHFLGMR
jgi:hypothetical protein